MAIENATHLTDRLTGKDLDALKAAHPHKTIYEIRVEQGEQQLYAYLREPSNSTMGAALSDYNQNKLLEAGETVFRAHVLAAHPNLLDDDDDNPAFGAACLQAIKALSFGDGDLAKV